MRGKAKGVLRDLNPGQRRSYVAFVAALEKRFGFETQTELHRMQLRIRTRDKDETLPDLAQSIYHLTKEAYPLADGMMRDALAQENFLDAVSGFDIRWKIAQARPKSLDEAVKRAVELEACRTADKQRGKYARLTMAGAQNQGSSRLHNQTGAKRFRKPFQQGHGPKCFNCDQNWHRLYVCPQELFCRFCISKDHIDPDCPKYQAFCTKCSSREHLATTCQNPPFQKPQEN